MNTSNRVYDVFTPSTPAKKNYIERTNVSSRIASSLCTPGKQIVIYGYSGVGKTSLLRKQLERHYEKEIITSCMTSLTFEDILLDAFDQLNEYYVNQKSQAKDYGIESSVANDYFTLKSSLKVNSKNTNSASSTRVVGVQLTASRLADFLGEGGYCWILEDFHKVDSVEKKKLSQAMKIFMDKSVDYECLKIIALGAVNTGREVVEYDSEMRKRISEIEVKLMSKNELSQIITNGEKLLNIYIEKNIHDDIVDFSNGLASVCHSICLYMCEEKGILSTVIGDPLIFKKEDLENAITRYMEEESDSMKDRFDRAITSNKERNENCALILKSLTEFNSDGATNAELMSTIKDKKFDYSQTTLTVNLGKLQQEERGGLVRFDNSSAKYSFREPFYKPFALAYFEDNKSDVKTTNKNSLKTLIGQIAYDRLVEDQMKRYAHK
jgi:GTPase SAR1 family protein